MKSQSSTEFMIFIGIAIIIMMSYFAIAHNYLDITYKQKDVISGQDFAKEIGNEINLAARVEDNYKREYQLPSSVGSKEFTVDFEKREVTLTLEGIEYVELLKTDINDLQLNPSDILVIEKRDKRVLISKKGSPKA